MAKQPSFQFYPGDWLKDAELRVCSHFARGLLLDLLCIMFEAKHRGRLCKPDGVTPWTDEQIVDTSAGGSREEKLAALAELESNAVLKRDEHGVLYSSRLLRDEEIRRERAESGSKGGSKTQANAKQIWQQSEQQKQSSSSSASSSTSVRSAAARHAAAVEGCSDIRKIDLTPLMREVEPADLGGLANGSLLGSLTPDVIADPSLMVNWFRQQLSHEEPVTGSTGLDLFLVLAKTLDIKRRSNRLKNPAGVLVQAFRSGEWLSNRECLREAKRLMDEAEARGELKWHLNCTEVNHV